jgi:hypothetical protein
MGTLDRSIAVHREPPLLPWPAHLIGLCVVAAFGLLACLRALAQRLRPN